MFCSKCGKELSNKDVFCPLCGNKYNLSVTNSKKNNGKVFLFIALGLSLIADIVSVVTFLTETFTIGVQVFNILSVCLVLISSIICLVKSKTAKNRSGRTLGIVFSVLSSIQMFFLIIMMTIGMNYYLYKSDELDVSRYKMAKPTVRIDRVDKNTKKAIEVAAEELYYSLNKCNTLTFNKIKADVKNGDLDGYYYIYFEYSTNNISDKCCCVRMFKNNDQFALISIDKLNKIPNKTENGTLCNFDYNQINSYINDLISFDSEN